ncbi:TRAP transporter small permease [bacterium]|nr:TRAP transporter small permease [bacterium]
MKGRSAFDFTLNLFALLAILIIIFVLISVCLAVFMRYFLRNPMGWVVQTSQYSLVFVTFLGAAWALKRERHVTMDLITNMLSPGKKAMLGLITSTIGTIICLVITFYSTLVTLDHFRRNIHDMQVLEVPLGPMFAVITLGSFMLFVQFLRRGYGYLEQWRASRREQAGQEKGRKS